MLLEMQSAMNNMMNNSQLHNQTLPVAKPLASEDAGPAPPSPSSSPRSSQSDGGPECEPAVAMDTSSASPSTSDGGEEEMIGSVTRAHQETFMYNQERSSLTAAAPPSVAPPFAAPPSCSARSAANLRTEEQQEAWNHHNNLLTSAAQGSEVTAADHCPFRLTRGAVSHSPAYIHGAFGAAEGPASGPLWRGGNRMHLVRTTEFRTT